MNAEPWGFGNLFEAKKKRLKNESHLPGRAMTDLVLWIV